MAATERACWMELAAQVEGLGVYTVSDFSAFKLLVRTVWMAEQADGFMPPTARVRLAQAAHSALASFGLSPASRGKVAAAPKRERDAVAEFLGLTAIPGGKG